MNYDQRKKFKMIKSAELILYNENDDTFSLDLNPTQLYAIYKILGLQIEHDEIICFSDESLKTILEKIVERWTLL